MQLHICNTALWCSWILQAQQSPARWNIVQELCSAVAAAFHHSKKKACFPAIVLVCPACYAEWNKPPLDWMRMRALWIRVIKRDFLLELKRLTTLCLWELSGHVYYQVKCKLKPSHHHSWSSKISEQNKGVLTTSSKWNFSWEFLHCSCFNFPDISTKMFINPCPELFRSTAAFHPRVCGVSVVDKES